MKKFIYILFVFFIAQTVSAQQPVLEVATIERHPFVIADETGLSGFSIDLWEAVAQYNGWESEFLLQDTFTDLLAAPRTGKADAAIANISITADREEIMDFSSSIYDGGMQIMVSDVYRQNHILYALSDKTFSHLIKILLGFTLLCMVLYWLGHRLSGRKTKYENFAFSDVFAFAPESRGDLSLYTIGIRYLWWFGLVVLGMLSTAALSAAFMLSHQTIDIDNVDDLRDRRIGVISGSTSESFLRKKQIAVESYSNIDNMFREVSDGRLEAVVHDAPVITYYAFNAGLGKVALAGEPFNPEQYGIALPSGSLLLQDINESLLRLRETGVYDQLYRKWFTNN